MNKVKLMILGCLSLSAAANVQYCTFYNDNSDETSYCLVYACAGESITASMCSEDATCTGDTFLYLSDENGNTVASNDDACSVCSFLTYTVPSTSSCQNFFLNETCYIGSGACGGQVEVNVTAVATVDDDWPNYDDLTDDHTSTDDTPGTTCYFNINTANDVQNCELFACGGWHISASMCGENNEQQCTGDTVLSLISNTGTTLTSNDDYCGYCSRIEYNIPQGTPCQQYTLQEKCFSSTYPCGGNVTVDMYLTGGDDDMAINDDNFIGHSDQPTAQPTASVYYSVFNLQYEGNFETVDIYACGGQSINASMCNTIDGTSCSGDTFLTLYAPGGAMLTSNDDHCGFCSEFTYHIPDHVGCAHFTLKESCWSYPCGGIVAISGGVVSDDDYYNPLDDIYNDDNEITYSSFDLEVEDSYNPVTIYACDGEIINATMCSDYSWCSGDTYLELLNDDESSIYYNDDTCGYCSEILYEVPYGSGCQYYTLKESCYSYPCSGTVAISGATVTSDAYDDVYIGWDDDDGMSAGIIVTICICVLFCCCVTIGLACWMYKGKRAKAQQPPPAASSGTVTLPSPSTANPMYQPPTAPQSTVVTTSAAQYQVGQYGYGNAAPQQPIALAYQYYYPQPAYVVSTQHNQL